MQTVRLITHAPQQIPQERVSVIVPTFNRSTLIGPCLESLLNQTVPAAEIIVVDDGSEDATPEVVQRYAPRVTYLRKENGGKPNAFKHGLEHSSGDLIWVFDDDDVAAPSAIETRLRTLREHPSAGFVFAPHLVGDDHGDGVLCVVRTNQVPEHTERFLFDLMCGCFFHLNSCLVRREHVVSLDGFDPQLKAGEDYDFQIRLAQRCAGVRSPDPVFSFRRHGGLRGDKTMRYLGEERGHVFRQFDVLVGQKIKRDFELSQFLIPPQTSNTLSDIEQRVAHVGRALVMASKGCIGEMIEDLLKSVELADRCGHFSTEELQNISSAMYTGYAAAAVNCQWDAVVGFLGRLKHSKEGRRVRSALVRGLFKRARSYPGTGLDRIVTAFRALLLTLSTQTLRK